MGRLGMWEMLIIFLIVLVLFGAKKLPEIGSSLGKAIKEFLKTSKDIKKEIEDSDEKTGQS